MTRPLLVAALALAPLLARAAPPAAGFTSCRVRAPRQAASAPAPAAAPAPQVVQPTPDVDAAELEASIRRFDEEGRAYRAEAQSLIERSYDQARRAVAEKFDRQLDDVEALEKSERQAAIARFEEFLRRYPDDPVHTPEAMFRLAELRYEQANDEFEAAVAAHTEEAQRAVADGREPPPEPQKSYAPSIALYQKILTGFPDYPFQHGVQYLLAYALGEMGQEEEAREAYATLIAQYPRSPYVPEAWVRLGDHWFDAVAPDALVRASAAYQQLQRYPEHPLYARAQYKLGWTRYRMDDFGGAVDAFTKLLDHYVAAAVPGTKPGGDVWPEAVQYIAISFADERGGGIDRAVAYYAGLGGRPYEAEVYSRIGDVYFEETRWAQAVAAYKAVLAKDPLSPDAPRIQARIVLAWSRDRRFDREAAEREALVAAFAQGSPWYTRNQGDPALVAAVRDLSEQSLLRAASFHHAQAQQFKADGKLEAAVAEYRVAAKAYGEYVGRFPHSKQAHEMSYRWADCLYNALDFEKSARVYAAVRDDPASDQYRAESALSAVIAWEGEVTRLQRLGQLEARKVLRSTDRRPDEVVKAEPLPVVLQDLVRDSDALLDRASEQERAPAIAYKAGELFYQYGDFDEARCRFEEVVSTWPSTPVAQYAANLIIESYLTTKDWVAVEQASARLQTGAVGQNKELNATLQKFKLGGRFNRAMQLMDAKQYEPAAATFLALVAEEPGHEFADKALFNAAACYEGARRFESALKLYERIPAEYPKSTLADEALFRVGFNAENTYEFEKAVDRYVQLVNRYPSSKHRKNALYNAARSLENLQRYDEAADAFARYARTYPEADDAARSMFHAALIYEKADSPQREVQALQGFVGKFSKTREHELVVQAQLKMGLAYRKVGDHAQAQAAYGRAVREFAARGLKPEVNAGAAAAAAEARFRLAEYDFERYDRIQLPASSNTKKLQKALQAKLTEAKKVAPQYDEVMKYKRPDWILAAFYRKAYLLERLAQTLYDAPIPPDVKANEELLAAYQDQLSAAAAPFEEQAVKVYVDAIDQARRLHVKNEWTKKIAESLARYRPSEYPVMKDAKVRMLQDDLSPAPFAETPDGPTRRAAPAQGDAAAGAGPGAPGGEATEKVQPAAKAAGDTPGERPATVDAPAKQATPAGGART